MGYGEVGCGWVVGVVRLRMGCEGEGVNVLGSCGGIISTGRAGTEGVCIFPSFIFLPSFPCLPTSPLFSSLPHPLVLLYPASGPSILHLLIPPPLFVIFHSPPHPHPPPHPPPYLPHHPTLPHTYSSTPPSPIPAPPLPLSHRFPRDPNWALTFTHWLMP